jgi:hypothetical protein
MQQGRIVVVRGAGGTTLRAILRTNHAHAEPLAGS